MNNTVDTELVLRKLDSATKITLFIEREFKGNSAPINAKIEHVKHNNKRCDSMQYKV